MNTFINERDKYQLNLFAKAATTTLKIWFWYDLQGRHEEFASDPSGALFDRQGRRMNPHETVNPLAVRNQAVGDDYQIFTVVRNPFSRLVSAYLGVMKNKISRKDFVEKHGWAPDSFPRFIDLLHRGELEPNVHWLPQSSLLGPAGNILHVENLAAGFDMMCDKLGKTRCKLPRINTRRSFDPTAFYTDETADIVRQLYADDFERFGFSTDVPEKLSPRAMAKRRAVRRRGSIDEAGDLAALDLRRFDEATEPCGSVRGIQPHLHRGKDFYRERVERWGFTKQRAVIDVGCGFGKWSIFLAEVNERVYGIEPRSGCVAMARGLSDHLGLDNVEYEAGDPTEIPVAAETFDAAWCFGTLHHFNRAELLREIHRVLTPEGMLFLGSLRSTARVLQRFFAGHKAGGLSAAATRRALQLLRQGPLNDGPASHTTPETIGATLNAHGFELCADHPVEVRPHGLAMIEAWADELEDLPALAARLEIDDEFAAEFARHPEVTNAFPRSLSVRARKLR